VLWDKACHDWNAAERLLDADPELVGDQVFGFLLQQSVEKATKSVLARKRIKYDRVHDLGLLLDTLSRKIEVPPQFGKLRGLTMYATSERYESPPSPHRLDRREVLDLVREFLTLLLKEAT
jgi:HEPN domain-containing protein